MPKADTGQDKRLGHSGIQSLRLARRVIGESPFFFLSSFFAHSRRLCCLQRYTTKQKESKMKAARPTGFTSLTIHEIEFLNTCPSKVKQIRCSQGTFFTNVLPTNSYLDRWFQLHGNQKIMMVCLAHWPKSTNRDPFNTISSLADLATTVRKNAPAF